MGFPSSAPFMMMASADYAPYPLHTASASAPLRRQTHQEAPTASTLEPKAATRVDSGLDDVSPASSITFTEEVESVFAARQFLLQRYYGSESESGDQEGEDEDRGHGGLGLRAVDSIEFNAGRASVWEDKEDAHIFWFEQGFALKAWTLFIDQPDQCGLNDFTMIHEIDFITLDIPKLLFHSLCGVLPQSLREPFDSINAFNV
ncbi:hypothetical protein SVAN01_05371 [Stagonosporopsis vannaccii]|nr:hypothetical protein SVAN01_05371 [Stagonosporopsis vannaccii]